jgi:hypothetical protein
VVYAGDQNRLVKNTLTMPESLKNADGAIATTSRHGRRRACDIRAKTLAREQW